MSKTATLKLIRSEPQKATRTKVDTILITPELAKSWKDPPFQRPLKVNEKVRALAEEIKINGGVLPGIITIGLLDSDRYLVDGQHRREAFVLSELAEGFSDVRYVEFDDIAEMGEEFVKLNSRLVSLRPDDILRGLEASTEALSIIRKRCPFVGYDFIRRGAKSAVMSMSILLRCWWGSSKDVPASSNTSAATIVKEMSAEDAAACADFMVMFERAIGRDFEYARLWGALNLAICMWLWRRTVTTPQSPKTKITKANFEKCLASLSADGSYIDWLLGRQLSDRDRSPAYQRIKKIFAIRLQAETGTKAFLPSPPWCANSGSQ